MGCVLLHLCSIFVGSLTLGLMWIKAKFDALKKRRMTQLALFKIILKHNHDSSFSYWSLFQFLESGEEGRKI